MFRRTFLPENTEGRENGDYQEQGNESQSEGTTNGAHEQWEAIVI